LNDFCVEKSIGNMIRSKIKSTNSRKLTKNLCVVEMENQKHLYFAHAR
jgi:hypothetical protein